MMMMAKFEKVDSSTSEKVGLEKKEIRNGDKTNGLCCVLGRQRGRPKHISEDC